MLLKIKGELSSVLYVLDEDGNKIRDLGIYNAKPYKDVKGNPAYKTAVCRNENLILINGTREL